MTKVEFIKSNIRFARETQNATGIHHLAILAQAALESGWGKAAPGNMFFGVKDNDSVNGNEQLLKTTEYSRRMDLKFPEIISVTPVIRRGEKFFKYVIRDYFRKYATPGESFTDHARFLTANKRYARAMLYRNDPYVFIDKIALAGYATDPTYAVKLKSIAHGIEEIIKREAL